MATCKGVGRGIWIIGLVGSLASLSGTAAIAQEDAARALRCPPGPVVGEVLSVSGNAWAEGPDGRRSLICGEPIRRCEQVVTAEGAQVGLLAADVYVQVDSASRVALEPGAGGGPGFAVLAGRARFVDTRAAGAPTLEIRPAPGAAASGADVTVSATGVVTDEGVPLAGAAGCIDVAVRDHVLPGVGPPPPTSVGLMPIDPDRLTYGPCDDPGTGCLRINPATMPGAQRRPSRRRPPQPVFGTDDTR